MWCIKREQVERQNEGESKQGETRLGVGFVWQFEGWKQDVCPYTRASHPVASLERE